MAEKKNWLEYFLFINVFYDWVWYCLSVITDDSSSETFTFVLYLIPAGVPDYNIHVLANYNDNDLNLLMDLVVRN